MYVDKLDGRVDAAFFDKMAAEWRGEQARCQREIDRHQEADKSYMDVVRRHTCWVAGCGEQRRIAGPSLLKRGESVSLSPKLLDAVAC
jgi:hypothetical protein